MVNIEGVRHFIDSVLDDELARQRWTRVLGRRLDDLSAYVIFERPAAVESLVAFCEDYIRLAPDMLAQIHACARASRTEALFRPFLHTCVDYFIHPTLSVLNQVGPDGLLVRAYQCHRLIEELYDGNLSLRNSRLCNLEATQANLLAHALIGEPFANELDAATELAMRKLVRQPDYHFLDLARYLEQARSEHWAALTRRWQHLLSQHGMVFRFSLGME